MLATTSTTIWFTMRATGVVALVLLTATVVLGIATAGRARTRRWPAFAWAELHKRLSLLAMSFLAIHVLTAGIETYVNVGWVCLVVPVLSSYRPLWVGLGTVALDLLAAVALTSALRQRIRARTWRAVHRLAYGCWPLAMAHVLGAGTDSGSSWLDVICVLCGLSVFGALFVRMRVRVDGVGRVMPEARGPAGSFPVLARSRTPARQEVLT